MREEREGFWAVVEIMGHKRYAGFVSEHVIGGASFVRVDVPACDDKAAFSKMFGASSIYCITPVTEDVARGVAGQIREEPITPWDIPQDWRDAIRERALPSPRSLHEIDD